MPTYEYQCQKCGKTFDFMQSMKDAALKVCPKDACRMRRWGKGKVNRLLSAGAGLIFKGSGFYITDYRSENYKQGVKKEKEASAPKKEAAGDAKKETKKTPPKSSAS